MAIPKSKTLQATDSSTDTNQPNFFGYVSEPATGPIQIREIPCLNDMVAILQFNIQSSVLVQGDQQFKNEGIVIGVGPGIADNAGGRVASQLRLGDVVMFADKNIVAKTNSDKPPYAGKQIIFMSERSLICLLPPVPYELLPPKTVTPWIQTGKE